MLGIETMGTSLKDKNKIMLVIVVLANIAVYLVVLYKGFAVEDWTEMLASTQKLVPVLLFVAIVVSIVNAQIGHENKARLVFWKWKHPLPGSRTFTEYMSMDSRIDKEALRKHNAPLPTNGDKQNALWFKWYREFQNEDGILQVHKEYLFTRDYTGISLLLMISFGILGFWQMDSSNVAGIYLVFLLLQYLFVRRAACNHGIRFVTSVLAYKASSY